MLSLISLQLLYLSDRKWHFTYYGEDDYGRHSTGKSVARVYFMHQTVIQTVIMYEGDVFMNDASKTSPNLIPVYGDTSTL